MYKYEVIMQWSEKYHCYITTVPDLPGCMSDGKTPEEAMHNTQEVIGMWIESAIEDGNPIPQPSCPPLPAQNF